MKKQTVIELFFRTILSSYELFKKAGLIEIDTFV